MNRDPRVLVSGVVLGQPAGGVRRHNAELLPRVAERLARKGGELVVLEGAEPLAFPLDGVRRVPSDAPPGPPIARAMQEGKAIARAVQDAADAGTPFDLVHTGHLPVPHRLPLPFTITLHDLRHLELSGAPFLRRFMAKSVIGDALRRAQHAFTVSAHVRDKLLERYRLPEDRVSIVPNAADHFTPLPRAAGEDAPLLHVGHLESRKNLELLLRALAADESLPDLLLAGAPKANEGERLEALADELGVRSRVRFGGPFEEADLARLYARAACVVLPSRLEGFGIPVLEAQRARVPLAVANAGALPEVAGKGVPTFDCHDPEGCAQAIHAAIAQDEEALDAHARNANRFTWDLSADTLVRGWRAAVKDRS